MSTNTNSGNINPNTGLPYTKEESLILTRFNSMNAGQAALSPLDTRFQTTGSRENYSSPEELNSYIDRGVSIQAGGANEEVRAENQSAGEQLLHGLGKMAVLTGTTFLDGTVGTVVGLGNLLTGGSFIDNPFSNAMQDLNEKSEQWMPNYYTQEGQGAFSGIIPFTEGSANFWGDKILKNFGFALGAYFSGLATAGLGNLAAERVLASRTAKAITNAMLTEGKSQSEITKMLKAFQTGDPVALDYMKKSEVFLNEIKSTGKLADNMSIANQWVGSVGGAVGESRVEALGNARAFKEQEIAKLEQTYGDNIPENELAELDNRVDSYMNTTFGINMAILTLSDYAQFADAFKPKYSKLRSALNDVEGSIETGFKAIPQSNLSKAWNLTKNPIYEGTQEQLQFAAQKGGDEFYTKRYDENGKEVVNNFLDSYMKGLSEAYGTAEGWEMFATGAIIGALGMPNIPKITGQKGLVQGGVYGEYQEMKEREATTNANVATLNKTTEDIKNNGVLKDTYEHLVRINNLNAQQKEALIKGDKFEYQNKEEDKLLSQTLAFYNAGKIEDLEAFYKGLADKKGSDIRTLNTITTKEGKTQDPFNGLTDAQIESYYKNKSAQTLKKIEDIKSLKESIDSRFSTRTEAFKETLLHYAYTVKDLDTRFNELSKEVSSKIGQTVKPEFQNRDLTVSDRDLETPMYDSSLIFEDPIELSKFINKEGGLEEYTKLIKDHIKKHPEDLDLEEKANDLVKIAQRKKEFLNKYTEGLRDKGKTLEEKIKDILSNKDKQFIKKQQAVDDFKNKAVQKGYSLDRVNNKEGIFITVGGKLMQLRTLNGKQVAVDPLTGQTVHTFDEQNPFDKYISNSSQYLNVLSRDEANEYIKQIRLDKIRNAQLAALQDLLRDTKQKGKEVAKEIADKKKSLNKKIEELRELVDDYFKTNFKDEVFRSEIESLISELEETINVLKEEIQSLQKEREKLLNIYSLYEEEKKNLESDEQSFTNISGKIVTESAIQNLVNEGIVPGITLDNIQESVDYIDNLIKQYTNDLEEYERIKADLQKLLDDDKELRDLIVSLNSEEIFKSRYSGQIRKEITPRFVKNFLIKQKELNNYNNPALDRINSVLDKIEANPEYVKDLIALIQQKEKLKELNESIRYTEHNVALVEPEIQKLKNLLKDAQKRRETLLDMQERLEYKNKGLLAAYIRFRDKAKQYFTREKVEGIIKADDRESEGQELQESQIKAIKNNSAKKGTPKSTTGSLIQYDQEHLRKTGEYKDLVDEEGNPLYTDSESQLRWGNFLEANHNDIKNGEYKLKYHLHNPNSNDALDEEINNAIPRDKIDSGNDIYVIIVDKEGKPVKVNDKFLFTGIHKTETLFPESGGTNLILEKALVNNSTYPQAKSLFYVYYEKLKDEKLTLDGKTKTGKEWLEDDTFEDKAQELITTIIEFEKKKFNDFRESVKKQLSEGKELISDVTSISAGIPVINKKVKRKAADLLNKGYTLEQSSAANESGLWYAITPEGNKIPVETELLDEKQADAVIAILQYAMPKDSNVVIEKFKVEGDKLTKEISIFPTNSKNSTQPSLLVSLIYYGRSKDAAKPYNIWGKEAISFMDGENLVVITREELHNNPEKLRNFLLTKRLNISQTWANSNNYFYEPTVDSQGKLKVIKHTSDANSKDGALSGYRKFLKKHLRTRIVEKVTGKPLFVNKYLVYKDPAEIKPVKPSKPDKTILDEDNDIPSYEIPDNEYFDDLAEMRELEQAKKDGAIKKMGSSSVSKEMSNMSTPFTTESTEEVIREEPVKKPVSTDAKADIERRRQENDNLGKSILQKLGYKNQNRLPNGNVKGGQAGWKIRFNIKNPKTGESYYDGKGTATLLNNDYDKRAETLINFLLGYFGSNEKADSKNLQKHYVLEDENGTKREPFKHLSGGEIGESDFTIYVGSADDVMKFISDIRTKHPEILELLHAGNKSEDVVIDDIFKGRIEGRKIGFSGYHTPSNLNKVIGSDNFTFNFNSNRVNINYNGDSLSDITIIVEDSTKGYWGVFDENLKKDYPELYKNIRNIIGFQLYGDYLQGANNEFLKLTGVDKINAKYDAEPAALENQEPSENLSAFGITAQSEKDFLNDLVGGDEVTSDKTNDKNKVSTMTKEDAVNRVKELLQEGTIDKKCN